jgi:hypothetical protein
MCLVCKRKRGITDALEMGNGILEWGNIARHSSGDSWCDITVLHAAYSIRVSLLKIEVTTRLTYLRYIWVANDPTPRV